MANEFKDLKGKPLSPLPYEPKPTPDHLDQVEKPANKVDASFGFSNYMRLLWMYWLDNAESKLNPVEYAKASKFWTIASILSFVLNIILFYWLAK